MNDPSRWRNKARAALEQYLRKRSLPRLTLGLLLLLTGACGFLISLVLLRLGVTDMWIRYPVAVLGAYGAFLILIRAWVEVECARFDPDAAELSEAPDSKADAPRAELCRANNDGLSWLDWLDVSGLDFDDGCLPLILLGVVVGLVAALAVTLMNAPILLAEVFLDAFVLSLLYRRLRVAAKEHWLGTAIKRTWGMVLIVAGLLAVGGWCLEALVPGSQSIGPAVRGLLEEMR